MVRSNGASTAEAPFVEGLEEVVKKRQGKSLRHKAMDMLARREYAEGELRQKLEAKGNPPEAVAEVVAQLCEEDLVSDERFTEAFVRSRMNSGYGPLRIQAELRERGVDDTIQAIYLDFRDALWVKQAAQVRSKRFGPEAAEDYKERARQARFLQYRGFTSDQARQVLDGYGLD
jgi:regulatory protein